MTVQISPIYNIPQFLDSNGVPLNGGLIYQYQAGSDSIEVATYTDHTGGVANANPIVLDSSGRLNTAIWLTQGVAYNLVMANSGNTVLENFDYVTGVPVISAATTTAINIWNAETDVPTYVSTTEFLIPNNHVVDFAVGNRVRAHCTSGLVYGTVITVTYTSPNTYVTMQMDSTLLDSGLSQVDWSSLIASGRTVDAGGVSYSSSLTYSTPNTVGGQITNLNTAVATLNTRVNDTYLVNPASGSGANTPYVISVDSAITSYAVGQRYTVQFLNASVGSPTLNVNSIGAVAIKMYDYNSVLQTATMAAGFVSDVAYDGTEFILLDQQPPIPFTTSAIPHGQVTITATETFTPGTGVTNINVICVGGGGGGGRSSSGGGESPWSNFGGSGGFGGSAFKNVSVTPLTTYSVTIGAAGTAGVVFGPAATAGGSTTFGAGLVIATGGQPGGDGGAGPGVPGTDGANGYDATGAFGLYNAGFTATGALKGVGGASDSNGTPGLCIITW